MFRFLKMRSKNPSHIQSSGGYLFELECSIKSKYLTFHTYRSCKKPHCSMYNIKSEKIKFLKYKPISSVYYNLKKYFLIVLKFPLK